MLAGHGNQEGVPGGIGLVLPPDLGEIKSWLTEMTDPELASGICKDGI